MTLRGHFENRGLKRGLRKGRLEGEIKGEIKGEMKEKRRTAMLLIKKELPFDDIAEITSLDKAAIIKLAQKKD